MIAPRVWVAVLDILGERKGGELKCYIHTDRHTDRQTDRQKDRTSDEAGPRGAFALKNWFDIRNTI